MHEKVTRLPLYWRCYTQFAAKKLRMIQVQGGTMTQQDAIAHTRRRLIGGSLAIGVTGLLPAAAISAKTAGPDKFRNTPPLWPAPETTLGATPAPPLAAMVLNKAGFGPRPGEIDAFIALEPDDSSRLAAWVDNQLTPGGTDTEVDARLADLAASAVPAEAAAFDTIHKNP